MIYGIEPILDGQRSERLWFKGVLYSIGQRLRPWHLFFRRVHEPGGIGYQVPPGNCSCIPRKELRYECLEELEADRRK
jgi:hypothetical protein